MAGGQGFDNLNPPKSLTNPTAGLSAEYPRHMHKWVGTNLDGSPRLNEYIVVNSDAEMKQALEDGWSKEPIAKAPTPKKSKDDK